MKKIIATIVGLAAGATLLQAQGFIELYGSAAAITTNTGSFYNHAVAGPGYGSIVSGRTSSETVSPFGFDYALLYATSTNGSDESALGSDWNLVTVDGGGTLLGTNYNIAGAMAGNGTSAGVQINLAYNATPTIGNGTYYVMLVGWSSNLGSSWSQVEAQLSADGWNANGFFGETAVSTLTPYNAAGAGDPTVFTSMFPNGSMVLYAVPEPTTLALAGLGGMALLAFRRRNKKS